MTFNVFRASFRLQFAAGFAVCAAVMAYALYAQHVLGFEPCPLCIFQRVAYIALGLVFLVGAVVAPARSSGRALLGVLALVPAVAGVGIAARHVWMQHLPADQVPSCGPPLEFLRETFPLVTVVKKVLTGSGQCAKIDWTFLGLSMPQWSLLTFAVLASWAVYAAFRRR